MMDDFPGNSNRAREEKVTPIKAAPNVKDKKITPITSVTPIRRKTPLWTRFKETFFGGGDARGVWGYVMGEVLVPAAKDMVADATTQAVERAVFGEARRGPRGWRSANSGPIGHTRYDGMSRPTTSASPWRGNTPQREISRRGRQMHDFDEIIIPSRGEAEQVLETLFDLISEYQVASVADLYALTDITSAYTDQKYGWTDLQGARVLRVRGGYLLNLPKPELLE